MNWKGELAQILTFAVAPAIGALLAWWSVQSPRIARWTERRFRRDATLAWILTRLGTYVVVFHLFGYAGGHDMRNVWVPIAEAVLGPGGPEHLVDNLYGPLFPHVLTSGYLVSGGHGPATGLVFLLGDALALVLLHRIASRRLRTEDARRVVLFVLFSPLLWHGLIVRIQDESLFLFFVLLVQDCLDRRKEWAGAAAAAAGTLLTKALMPLYLFPVLIAGTGTLRDRARRVVLAGGATVAALGAALLLGWDPGGREYGTLSVRGSTSWLLFGLDRVSPVAMTTGFVATAVLSIAAAFAAWRVRAGDSDDDRAARGVSAVQSAFFVASPFALPSHLAHGLAHVAWQAVRTPKGWRAQLILVPFLVFQVVLTWLNPEDWVRFPPLIAAFVAWCAFVGWSAFQGPWRTDQDATRR